MIERVRNETRSDQSRIRRGFLKPFATRWYALFSYDSIEALKSVWVSRYNRPPQNIPIATRNAALLIQKNIPAHTKYTTMLRFVNWIASHTLVRPVSI